MKSLLFLAITLVIGTLPFIAGSGADRMPSMIPTHDSAYVRSYDLLLLRIEARRKDLADAYGGARSPAVRDSILEEARRAFVAAIADSIAPRWFGTPWEFYRVTEKPREGTIACGYFVSTLLRDAELKVDRVRMAQQASERIVTTLAREAEIRRFRNVPLDTFVAEIDAWGEGLYVVGLDYHVGFIYRNRTGVRFIHSSYIAPKCVVNQTAAGSAILNASKYRVVGKISANDELIRKWLRGTKVRTAG